MSTSIHNNRSASYQITIEGNIREDWSEWMPGLEIVTHGDHAESQTTIISGKMIDQAALRGIVCRLWDLNRTIVSIQRIVLDTERKDTRNEKRYFIL